MRDINRGFQQLFEALKSDFRDHLDSLIANTDYGFAHYVEETIKKLRDESSWNILVIFWLGIIDLRSFIFVHLA